MRSDSGIWWASMVLMVICLLAGLLAAHSATRADRRQRRKQADSDPASLMLIDGSFDSPSAAEIGGGHAGHHCDPGGHVGGFDGGCGGHH